MWVCDFFGAMLVYSWGVLMVDTSLDECIYANYAVLGKPGALWIWPGQLEFAEWAMLGDHKVTWSIMFSNVSKAMSWATHMDWWCLYVFIPPIKMVKLGMIYYCITILHRCNLLIRQCPIQAMEVVFGHCKRWATLAVLHSLSVNVLLPPSGKYISILDPCI